MSNEIIEKTNFSVFQGSENFETAQRMAKMLSTSSLVPKTFQGKVCDCVIALEIAQRTNASPLFVMQNLYIVHGKPSWSSQFTIAAINASGKFSPLRFKMNDDKTECYASAIEKETGEVLDGPPVSIEMAKAEGWYQKNGSKWQTMPELMLRYRSASFFGRLYAPEILMGMRSTDEVKDIEDKPFDIEIAKDDVNSKLEEMAKDIKPDKKETKPEKVKVEQYQEVAIPDKEADKAYQDAMLAMGDDPQTSEILTALGNSKLENRQELFDSYCVDYGEPKSWPKGKVNKFLVLMAGE